MRKSHNTQHNPDPSQDAHVSVPPPTAKMTSTDGHGTLRHIADQVADCFADSGYAFVEEDKIDGLMATLGSFLTVAGIPVSPSDASDSASRRTSTSAVASAN